MNEVFLGMEEKNNRLFYIENSNTKLDNKLDFGLDRGEEKTKNSKKKKFCFKECKKNTIKSLNEVEFFLNNLDKAFKCLHIYKILR